VPEVGFAPDPKLFPALGRAPEGGRLLPEEEWKKKILASCESDFAADRLFRREVEGEWYEALAMLFGRQYAVYSTTLNQLVEPPRHDWEVRAIHNFTLKHKRIVCSKLRSARPMPEIIPAGSDEQDRGGALTGNMVTEHVWREVSAEATAAEIESWFVTCGSCFWQPFWNPDIGPWVDVEGAPGGGVRAGEIDLACVMPFLVYPDRTARSEETCRYVTLASVRDTDWVKLKFPDFADDISDEATTDIFDVGRIAGRGGPGHGTLSSTSTSGMDTGRCVLRTRYEKPSPRYPLGRTIVWTRNVLLQYMEALPIGTPDRPMIPLIKVDYERVPGRYWGRGLVQIIAPMQVEYNRTISQLIEIRNLMGAPKILVDATSNVDERELNNQPGGIIKYSNTPPTYWSPDPPPAIFESVRNFCLQDAMDVAGQREVSSGRTPPNVEAGVAIQLLQQADDLQLASTIENMRHAMKEVGRAILWMAKNLYREPRILRIIGPDHEWHARQFNTLELAGAYDVTCETTDASRLNPAVARAELLRLYAMGLLGQPGSSQSRTILLDELGLSRLRLRLEDEERDLAAAMQNQIMGMTYNPITQMAGGPNPAQQMQSVGEGGGPLPSPDQTQREAA
jgi:hypothetical protein